MRTVLSALFGLHFLRIGLKNMYNNVNTVLFFFSLKLAPVGAFF